MKKLYSVILTIINAFLWPQLLRQDYLWFIRPHFPTLPYLGFFAAWGIIFTIGLLRVHITDPEIAFMLSKEKDKISNFDLIKTFTWTVIASVGWAISFALYLTGLTN